jgi:hypothetical protein
MKEICMVLISQGLTMFESTLVPLGSTDPGLRPGETRAVMFHGGRDEEYWLEHFSGKERMVIV